MVDWQSESDLDSIRNSCNVYHQTLLSYMVSSFSSMADINSSAFMMSASMSSISSESLINRKIRIIIADHCMLIKGFSNLVSRATCISAPQFECCWGYPAKSANGQDSPKTLPSWFSAKLNQARIWVSDFLITDNKSKRTETKETLATLQEGDCCNWDKD